VAVLEKTCVSRLAFKVAIIANISCAIPGVSLVVASAGFLDPLVIDIVQGRNLVTFARRLNNGHGQDTSPQAVSLRNGLARPLFRCLKVGGGDSQKGYVARVPICV
jgi:hypothetical protein